MTQPREETPVAEISMRGSPSCPLPVEAWTAPTSPGNDVWQCTWDIARQGSPPEPCSPEFSFRLSQVARVDHWLGWPFISSPLEVERLHVAQVPTINHSIRLSSVVQGHREMLISQDSLRILVMPCRSWGHRSDLPLWKVLLWKQPRSSHLGGKWVWGWCGN